MQSSDFLPFAVACFITMLGGIGLAFCYGYAKGYTAKMSEQVIAKIGDAVFDEVVSEAKEKFYPKTNV